MYFNDVDLLNGVNLTKEWINYRIDIFMKFTCKSLIKQTNQDFLALLRYNDESEELINEALNKYTKLPDNIKFIKRKEKNKLIYKTLEQGNYDYVFEVRLDSDDCYNEDYFEMLKNYKPKEGTQFLMNQKGYIYDSINCKLGYWYCKSSPFFVASYKIDDYLNKVRYKVERGHSGVINYPHEILNENNFLVIVHAKNTLTDFNKRLQGLIENKNEVKQILNTFM